MPESSLKSLIPDERSLSHVLDQVYQQYPRMKQYGFEARYRPEGPRPHQEGGGHLEFFHPDELYNPMQGVPYVEVYNKEHATPESVFGDMLHYLPDVDPEFAKQREDIWNSRTPDQRKVTQEAYKYSQENFGEKRPFDTWVDMSRKDAFLRGYINDQWPKDTYTDDQAKAFGRLLQYLQSE